MTTTTITNIAEQEPGLYKAAIALAQEADAAAVDSGFSAGFVDLLKVRVSQLNGCAFCLRWHTRDALAKGESGDRVAVLPAWRETSYFDVAEAAALALAEHVTRIGDRQAGEAPGAESLTPQQVAAVCWVVMAMGTLNRVAITSGYVVAPRG